MTQYCLSGGTLLTPDGAQPGTLLLRSGKIEAILPPGTPVSPDYVPVDCTGLYVSPGFVDIHQHGGGGSDYMDCDGSTYRSAVLAHLAHGTTSVMPTALSAGTEATANAVRAYVAATRDSAISGHLLGLHMEGPYISPAQAGAQKPEHIRSFHAPEYRALTELAEGHIKRWSVAPELPGAESFAAFARQNGIALSIAHSDADFDTVQRAFDWGFCHITHFYSCISTITRRGGFRVPGVLEAGYYLSDMDVEIIADGCHLPPALLSYVAKFKAHHRIALITDAMRAAGQDVKESFLGSPHDPQPVIVEDGVAKLPDRTAFAGSVATADRLVRNMVNAGVSLSAAVKMVTENPLRMMGLNVKKGRLQPGFHADLCIFDSNIQIQTVLCGGNIAIQGG